MGKIYKKFKKKQSADGSWWVVTANQEEIKIAKVASIKHPEVVAETLSSLLSNGKYALTDII